jgi:DNA polymerase III subunit delta'
LLAEDTIVPGFDTIIGQKLPIRLLQTFLHNATLPHALIFSGIAGIGKRTTAKAVAMALNCRQSTNRINSCGQCPTCRQIISSSHPDVIFIEPQGNVLRIDQIRNLLSNLSMKPYVADHRVVIISDAQSMNKEAANALLKVLEEPPTNTTLILTVLQKSNLLPTIISRCRHISFHPLSSNEIISLLQDTKGIDGSFIETAAALSEGSLTKAKQLAANIWREQRNWLICAAGLDEPPQRGQRSVATALAFAAQLSQKKELITDLLEILKTWIRDLSIWPYRPESVINSDYNEVLDRLRAEMDDRYLLYLWQTVEKAQKDIASKANLRLTLDVMALCMAGYKPAMSELLME